MQPVNHQPAATSGRDLQATAYNRLHAAVTVAFVLFFLFESYWSAKHNPLWMDEVLATWVIRLPNANAIWSAIRQGAEFSPPTYHLLLHTLLPFSTAGDVLLRAPSMLAILVTGLSVLTLLRRYLDFPSATFGMAWCLLSSLSTFGTQVRPYALLMACFSLALLLWDNLDKSPKSVLSAAGLALLLALCTSLHFYAVLFIFCFALMEAAWTGLHRRLRPFAWAAMLVGGLLSLLWLPLISTFSKLNAGDALAENYYARPTLTALCNDFVGYYVYDHKHMLLLMITAVLVLVSQAYGKLPALASTAAIQATRPLRNLYIMAFTTGAFPFLLYAFALIVTHTMNFRYGLITVIGGSLFAGLLIARLPHFPRVASPVLLVGCTIALNHSYPIGAETYNIADFLRETPGSDPIVIAEGYQYFQLEEASKDGLRSRLYYVTAPAGAASPDPTNENQVKRWIPIRPDLHIEKSPAFYLHHRHFYLLHTEESTDVLTKSLLAQGVIAKPVGHTGSAWLFEVQMP